MDENKPFMPPPPPKMPPFPPRPASSSENNDIEKLAKNNKIVEEKNEIALDKGEMQTYQNAEVASNLEEKSDGTVEQIVSSEPEKVVEEKTKKSKKKSSIATWLYWGGFFLCLAGIAVCLYFLVK